MASRSDDGEGKPVSREPPHSDKLSLWQSDAIAAPIPLRQRPCPLRRSAPALPKGEPWAKRAGFTGCKSLSLWERWHRAAMTERASPSPESRYAAISRFFGRAMLSLRLLFSVSILALSGAPRQLSQRESHWQAGPLPTGRPRPDRTQKGGPCYRGQQLLDNAPCQAAVNLGSGALPFSDRVSFARSAWASPARQCLSLWERWHRAAMTERASPSPESRYAAIIRFFVRAKI